ncbi:MAG: hypothetical protein R8J85_10285, partial [Mariprofundales bacterium]
MLLLPNNGNGGGMGDQASKFKCGDVVRVLHGVIDPDFITNIGGWSGRVERVDPCDGGSWMYVILWDQETLAAAGENYEEQCEQKELDCKKICLDEN